ncbi:MAG TPA: tyrosine-protein phosphatase [Micromonosporaceae bacterium]|nr:tyrosine-protein phosphatase [Micromonosporaceae bacterium]
MARRSLELVGEPNARDVGGPRTVDGRRVRRGMLYRSAALGRLTDDDVTALGKLGLARVIDMRDASEKLLAPPDRLPADPPPVTEVPIYDPGHPVFTYVSAVLLGHDLDPDRYAALAEEGTPAAMHAIYRWFVSGEQARAGFGSVLRILADPAQLPALVHCTAGKDRTGWLSTVVLSTLGVSTVDIEREYLATNELAGPVYDVIIGAMRNKRPELAADSVRPLFEARAEYLNAAYAEVDRLYDGFDGYLREGLGLDAATLDALRANLLEPDVD